MAKTKLKADATDRRRRMGRRGDTATRGNAALRTPHSALRTGFTLVELLVVMTILVIVTAMTVTAVNFTMTSERIRSGARQMQSFLEGARDRAIYAKKPRGVRFLLDDSLGTTDPRIVSSMVFIGPTDPWTQGNIQLERVDDLPVGGPPDNVLDTVRRVRGSGTGWWNLRQRGLLTNDARIKIPKNDGLWYTVSTSLLTATDEILELNVPYRGPVDTPSDELLAFAPGRDPDYMIELPPTPLAEEDPGLLPGGIVIDLDGSRLPLGWRVGGSYSSRLDVMFSPRGTVIGSAAGSGLIHFYLAELADTEAVNLAGRPPIPSIPGEGYVYGSPPQPIGDRILVTLFTQTGYIATHPVAATPEIAIAGNSWAVGPFDYAEVGERAGE